MNRKEAGLAVPGLLFGLPLLGLGIWMCVTMAVMPILDWRATHEWNATPCRVIELEQTWNEGKTIATVAPRYAYEFEGRSHTGTRYDFGNHRFDKEELAALTAAFPEGAEATCYVDPAAPEESVLTRDYNGMFTGSLIMGGLFFVLGAALTWIGVRWQTSDKIVSDSMG